MQLQNTQETPVSALGMLYADLEVAQRSWGRLDVSERADILSSLLKSLRQDKEHLATAVAVEMGKPITLARVEIDRTIGEFEYLLDIASESLASHPVPSREHAQGYVRYDPLGVVAVISPWNFPFLLPLRSIVPALLAGNTVIFKPSELTPRCGHLLGGYFERLLESSAPRILTTVYGGRELGAAVVELPVRAVCFTGSSAVGKQIAAASADTLKRLLLELGGLDAAIVLQDASIDDAAARLVQRNAANSGQVCNAVKRVYVERPCYEKFLERAVTASQSLVIGYPLDERTEMGPLVSESQLRRVQEFIADARQKGATVVCGGEQLKRPGYFLQHTIVTDISPDMRLLQEEPFGPILPIIPFDTLDEAIALANDTDFGLTASVWTADRVLAETIASRLDVGTVAINEHLAGGPGTPWGGTKQSGMGRMKTSETLRELSNIKFIRLNN